MGRPADEETAKLVPLLPVRAPLDGKPAGHVCERFACWLPVTEPNTLAAKAIGSWGSRHKA